MDITKEDLLTLAAAGAIAWTTIRPLLVLPTEPYSLSTLPIQSRFSEHILEPFVLRSAFGHSGIGRVTFEGEDLDFQNYWDWNWIAARVPRVNSVNARWVWKSLSPSFQIPEVWVAYPWNLGRTCMIKFVGGEAYQILYGLPDKLLCKIDTREWVTMIANVDFSGATLNLDINGQLFTLEMRDEPIGQADYVQVQFSLQGLGRVAIREMSVS